MLHVVQVDSRLPIIRGAEDMAYEKGKAGKSPFAKRVVPPDALSGDLLAPYGNCVYSLLGSSNNNTNTTAMPKAAVASVASGATTPTYETSR
ncbi:hypothetical protein NW756_009012 [Fusarium oxysporum]|nr:hypothetical protein Forpi1262_v015898 [Fusarium oxysporum f. sp. raphani]KAJ4036866.1 hypothetical protein NW753_011730 [Fusarium oxysporum]KAJ4041578.1 hypothetical protein NW763_011898 [Fusarium oxysporum]KAJ4084150.1 hypothetical protein NW756_009012 [Fusarium oxysporum]KAJ4107816.1 hypothetical protein NW769_008780 [Fusarium oxysporum]